MRGKQDNERAGCDRASLYAEITCKIIAGLERGCLPWVQPWASRSASAPLALPDNAATRRRYTGINVLFLWSEGIRRGFPANRWLTFRQALALGGHIRRGERGVAIVYADRFIPKGKNRRRDGPDEEGAAIPFLKRFTVFNVAQCDSLPEDVAVSALSGSSLPIEPQVEALIRASRIDFRVGGDRAIFRAASRAGEAADWLLGRLGPAGQPGAKSLVDRHP